jgi:hypothetical protein
LAFTPPPPIPDGDPDLASTRFGFADELADPEVRQQIYSLTDNEVGGQGPDAHQAFIETLFNRAQARGQSLYQTATDRNYYPKISFRPRPGADYRNNLLAALNGSDISGRATGNASGSVGFAGGPQTFAAGGERFGIEGPDLRRRSGFTPPPPIPDTGAPAAVDPLAAARNAAFAAGQPDPLIAAVNPAGTGLPDHSQKWNQEQAQMRAAAIQAGLPDIQGGRDRLIDAITRSEAAGYPVQHKIGKPDEPTGDYAPTMDVQNLVNTLKEREKKDPSVAKERAYWENELKSGMFTPETGEEPILDKFMAFAKKPSPESFLGIPLRRFDEAVAQQLIPSGKEIAKLYPPAAATLEATEGLPSEAPILTGAAKGTLEQVAKMSSPGGIALLGAIPEGIAGKAIAGGFTLQGLSQFPELYRRFIATDDPEEKAKIVAEAAVSVSPALGLLPKGRAGAATKAEPKPEPRPEPTAPEPTAPAIPPERYQVINDLVPALRIAGKGPPDAIGQRGQTHADIIKENPEVGAEITDEGVQHGFALGDEFISRQKAADMIGQDKPLTSQALRDLQAQPVPVGPSVARFEPPRTTADITRFILNRNKVIQEELGPLLQQQETMRAAGLRLDPGAEARIAELQAELAKPNIPEGGEVNAIEEGDIAQGGVPEHQGVPPRPNVRTYQGEVRQGAGRQAGGGGGIVGEAPQPTAVAPVQPGEFGKKGYTAEPVRGTQADVAAAREAAGVDPYERELTRTWGKAADVARERDARYPGYDERLAQKVAKKPRPVTDDEHVSLLRNWQKAELDHKAAVDAMNSARDAATREVAQDRLAVTKDRLQEAFSALDKTGTAAGRGFNIRKMILKEFYSPEAMEARFRAAKGGKALTEAEAKQLNGHVKDVQEASVARGKVQSQLEADARFAQRAQESVGKKANGAKSAKDINDILKAEADAARARIAKERGKVEWTKEVEPCIL